jgi:hypothetical protein
MLLGNINIYAHILNEEHNTKLLDRGWKYIFLGYKE